MLLFHQKSEKYVTIVGINGELPYLINIFIEGKNIDDHNGTLK